jgi:hypothetical protein
VGVFMGMLLGALGAIAFGAFDRRRRAKAPAPPLAESPGNGHVDNADIVLPDEQSVHTAVSTEPHNREP